ncbi:hypothetical protein GCM10011428_60220 [Streptomyces violaceus]
MNACCNGWSWSPSAKPSMVVTSAPSSRIANVRHEFTPLPVEEDRARPAGTGVAAFLGAGQLEVLAQQIQ